ncbi:MAG: hypothetical protein WBY53_19755 [Acidobacteriaceae bacterium]
MRKSLHLAALLTLFGALTATTTRAQITNPDNLIAPPPHNPALRSPTPTDNLQWLWQYTHPAPIGQASNLRLDARFQTFLQANFHQPQSMWGPPNSQEPLATIIPLFLTQYGAVTADDNRYITIDGCVPSFCAASGLLWIDLGRPHPLAVFAAVNWDPQAHTTDQPQANYNLWLFANRTLSPDSLPFELTQAIAHWNIRLAAAHRLVPHIAHALLVDPDGSPIPLNPDLAGANAIAPQPDTTTPKSAEDE